MFVIIYVTYLTLQYKKYFKIEHLNDLLKTTKRYFLSFFVKNLVNNTSLQMEILHSFTKIFKSYTIEGVDPTIPGLGGKECTEFLTINR